MGHRVGRGQITQYWLACLTQWWIQSKGTFQCSPYLFLLAARVEWQWRLAAAQLNVWRFPHICILLNHKTHLLALNWHTWEGFPSGEQATRQWGMGRKRLVEQKANISKRIEVRRTLTKYEKLSFDDPVPLCSTSTWTIFVWSCVDLPVTHTSLGNLGKNISSY